MTVFIEEEFGEPPQIFVTVSSLPLSTPLPVCLFLAQFAVLLYQATEVVCQDAQLFRFSAIPSQGSQLFFSLPLLLFHCLRGPLMLTTCLGRVMVVVGLEYCCDSSWHSSHRSPSIAHRSCHRRSFHSWDQMHLKERACLPFHLPANFGRPITGGKSTLLG